MCPQVVKTSLLWGPKGRIPYGQFQDSSKLTIHRGAVVGREVCCGPNGKWEIRALEHAMDHAIKKRKSLIKHTLAEFAEMSGLHVNPNKSTIILSKAVRSERRAILDLMGFPEAVLPIKYLGVPLIASRLTVADCQPLIDRFNNRLAGWGHLLLSFAGRLQLIKSVLSSLHMYWSSVFILPKAVIKALMLRHIWRILQRDPRSIWVAWVLRYRLRNQTLWTSSVTTAPWCWRKLIKLCPLLRDGLDYRVGDGCQFKLWGDIWHPRGPLLHSFPRGPRITGLPADAMLQEVIQQGQWSWPALTEFDIQEIVSELPPIYPNQTDEIKWKHNTGMCTTAALYSLLTDFSSGGLASFTQWQIQNSSPWVCLMAGDFGAFINDG
ncbi:UNVERIFIED_CONTAM: hypothetical protein Sradi_6970900 [Sesamum radiatum]|uniref:Reverse transcriptase n=1 Tax=Sesamum radiatum TaxID=300843 RepID=A0AAW2JE06_SESRA